MVRLAGVAWVLGLVLTTIAPGVVSGQEADLVTDRPDFTESGVVVPRGSIQLEFGVTWLGEADGDVEVLSGPEALLRWGVASRLELRIGLPDYLAFSGSVVDDGAWTDSSVGIKWQLGPIGKSWDLALIAEVELPTGEIEATADTFDPGLILTTGAGLSERWSIGVQASASRETLAEAGGNEELWLYGGTLVFGLAVADEVGAFFEVAAEKPDDIDTLVLLHHGWTWLVAPTLQLDAHVAAGLTDTAPDWLVGIGLVKRW